MSQRFHVKRILLTAPGRNYEVKLGPGVNLITGPISTGKTSVLKLIDFVLGGRKPPSYPEISKCSDVLVEFQFGSDPLTIRRSLRGPDSKALVYSSTLDGVMQQNATPTEVSARHSEVASVSAEVMGRLSLGRIEVKTAPTQDASSLSAFSVRDLLMFVKVDQDRMGSSKAFFEEHFAKEIKWRAGFEIVHGFYDQAVAALSASLLSAEQAESALKQQLDAARTFLDQLKIADVESLQADIVRLETEEAELRQRVSTGSSANLKPQDRELSKQRAAIEQALRRVSARWAELRRTLEQLGRLRVQYERERSQIEFLKESTKIVGELPVVRCPSCFQPIERSPGGDQCHVCSQQLVVRSGEVSVAARLRSVRRRINDLDAYLKDMEGELAKLDLQKNERGEELRRLDASLLLIEQAQLLPHTRSVVELAQALSAVENRRQRAEEHLSLRLKARGEGSSLLELRERVSKLKVEVEALAAKKVDPERVIESVSKHFNALLAAVKFPNLNGARIDRGTYHPVLRNQDYSELSSKGALSLAITCWHLSLLNYALTDDSRFPLFLMLDSPLSHVGKDATDSEFRDQKIVDAFYVLLKDLHDKHGHRFQVLVCDNRPPSSARSMVTVEFTGTPSVGRFGLIDDEQGGTSTEGAALL